MQLSDLFRLLNLPASFYLLGQLPSTGLVWQPIDPVPPSPSASGGAWDSRVIAVMCRYLTSGYPVLVGTGNHAFVICGWKREPSTGLITFLRHDDQRGPYLQVGDVLNDVDPGTGHVYGPWRTLHVPLPPRLWLPPEPAERLGGVELERASAAVSSHLPGPGGDPVEDLTTLIAAGRLALRTYAIESNEFKSGLASRGFTPETASRYRLARMPRYIWVVEAVDRSLRQQGKSAVLGEVVIDATSSEHDPRPLVLRVHGALWLSPGVDPPILLDASPVQSGGRGQM